MVIEIFGEQQEAPSLDFKIRTPDGRDLEFQLPVIGESNVPTAIIAAIGSWQEAMGAGSQAQAEVVYRLLEGIRGAWPEQGRILWSLDFQTALNVLQAWFEESRKQGFDPKAPTPTHS